MKVVLAEHFGMCFGVRDAIALAERLAKNEPVTVLGQLVHNPIVRERLAARKVNEATSGRLAAGTRVLVTAHGTSDSARADLEARGLAVADATCPLVRHAHTQLKRLVEAGYFPVVIGQAGHTEVRGLTGDFPGAVVLSGIEEVVSLCPRARFGVIAQTTQPIEGVREIVSAICRIHPTAEVRFVDTVCKPTKDRQSALRNLLTKVDTLVVVGGRKSNNTLQLVAAGRAAGRRVVHVERLVELNESDFPGAETVGVTAGTSTLPETVAEVVARLEAIAAKGTA